MFGETAGACNALYTFCLSVVHDRSYWKSAHSQAGQWKPVFSHNLCSGIFLKRQDYLILDQPSRQVKLFEYTVNLEILGENLHDSIAVYGEFFSTDVFTNVNLNISTGYV